MYLVKTPWWLKALYPQLTWHMPVGTTNTLYLTFDDGPHPTATPFVLHTLQQYQALATFFCIGDNVIKYPKVYNQIIQEGHSIGNHTHNHLNGWHTRHQVYCQNVYRAAQYLPTTLFRPPYGRIKRQQAKQLLYPNNQLQTQFTQIVMWDVLSGDFDTKLTPHNCALNVVRHAANGSIIVFHDSTKAWERLKYALPFVLQHFSNLGYTFKAITPFQNPNSNR
jgi:peptidoglycan/xylan/chitin deacetylase (PgdA/CDA1 family)